jgi:crossover junction endodeoxyribonuclease RuvC
MDAVICGIDPGLVATGYAVIRGGGIIDAGVCRFECKAPLANRLLAIEADIDGILAEHAPAVVAVEQLYSHYNHPRTAILMGHARGVMLLAAARRGVEVRSYSATQIKRYLTGNGRATKSQMQRAVAMALGLPKIPEPPDVADALAIALCCASDLQKGAKSRGSDGSRGGGEVERASTGGDSGRPLWKGRSAVLRSRECAG